MTPDEIRHRWHELADELERLNQALQTVRGHVQALQVLCPHTNQIHQQGFLEGMRACPDCGKILEIWG